MLFLKKLCFLEEFSKNIHFFVFLSTFTHWFGQFE